MGVGCVVGDLKEGERRRERRATRYAVDGGNGNHGLNAQVGAGAAAASKVAGNSILSQNLSSLF